MRFTQCLLGNFICFQIFLKKHRPLKKVNSTSASILEFKDEQAIFPIASAAWHNIAGRSERAVAIFLRAFSVIWPEFNDNTATKINKSH